MTPTNDLDPQLSTNDLPKPKRTNWFWYFILALIIAIWTIWGALFFLAVVWVLRLNPSLEASSRISNQEKKTAQRIYTWLFLSSLLTVPIFTSAAANISYQSTIDERVFTALIPLILHVPLLLGLTSNSAFVYRHTQQGILLIALRAGLASLAVINMANHINYALMLFLLGNGSLWLFGTNWARNQVIRGECWLMDRKGEKIVRLDTKTKKTLAPESQAVQVHVTDKKLEQFLNGMNANEKQAAKEKSLEAFRSGIQGEIRKNAVNILSILGEVEKF